MDGDKEAPFVHATVQSPSLRNHSTERAVEGDVDTLVGDKERRGRNEESVVFSSLVHDERSFVPCFQQV